MHDWAPPLFTNGTKGAAPDANGHRPFYDHPRGQSAHRDCRIHVALVALARRPHRSTFMCPRRATRDVSANVRNCLACRPRKAVQDRKHRLAVSGPTFIRVLPADVAAFGAAAAIVIAHVRYRIGTDGPGRIQHDGFTWWRVTLRDLATDTGLSVKAVRTALKALHSVVLAKHFPPFENQSLAYRVAAGGDTMSSQLPETARADLPVAASGTPHADSGRDRARRGTAPCPQGHLHSSIETVGEGGERAPKGATPPSNINTAPLANNSAEKRLSAPDLSVDDQGRVRGVCSRHPEGTDAACQACERDRKAKKAWLLCAAEDEKAASRAARQRVRDCRTCDGHGHIETADDVVKCCGCPLYRQWQAGSVTAGGVR